MSNLNQMKRSRIPLTSAIQEDEIDVWRYIHFLLEEMWLILAVVFLVTVAGILYAYNAKPIYRTDALLQVEESKSAIKGLDDLSTAFGSRIPTVAEIEIIRSRSVIGAAVDKLKLAIVSKPKYFPLFGETMARSRSHTGGVAPPFPGLSKYAWGGERISIESLDVSGSYAGMTFVLVSLGDNRYRLDTEDGVTLLAGEIGKLSEVATPQGDSISIFVNELKAGKNTEFHISKLSRSRLIKSLQQRLSIREKGRNTGILELYMEGENPVQITNIVNQIARTYLRQNAERRSAEAETTLQFLQQQLPILKSRLDVAESNLNNYRTVSGNINLTMETQTLLENVSNLDRQLQELKLRKSELSQKYTGNHPSIIGIDQKVSRIENVKKKLNKKIKALPEAEQSSIQLMRDVKVANELYTLLLNKAQELKVVKAGTIGNVRILDEAIVPENSFKPRKSRIVIAALFIGLLVGVGLAFLRQHIFVGVRDPKWVENTFSIPVYASILHSKKQEQSERSNAAKDGDHLPVLFEEDPHDLSIEGLRSLRTSLQFAMMDAPNNIIAISGPSPGIGKSFLSVNLAFVLADIGRKVLIIDGDLRRGHIHRYFSRDRFPGLSDYISGSIEQDKIIQKTNRENVNFIGSGTIPPNPSELLTSDKFVELLEFAKTNYDTVVIDTPPVLAVTDGILISSLAGTLFLVLKSGAHHKKEIENTLRKLAQNNIAPNGIIFNDVPHAPIAKYGAYYNYYNYS